MARPKSVPRYCLHKQSGQAYVSVGGKQHLLGEHGSIESRERYGRIIAEFHATPVLPFAAAQTFGGVTVAMLIEKFWAHAQRYYVHTDGTSTPEVVNIKYALRFLNRLYGQDEVKAADFGPLALKSVREAMIRPDPSTGFKGWSRKSTNRAISRIKLCFKWGVENELVPGPTYQALAAVAGLRAGRSDARETAPVKPPAESIVNTVLPFLPPPVRAMVELEGIAGARGGELCIMRRCDIDMTDDACWVYRPATHKTAHRGHTREVPFGRRCQEIIFPFLAADWEAYLFSPAAWEIERRRKIAAARKTPEGQGNAIGTNRIAKPERKPGERYTPASYRKAVTRACDAAFPPPAELARGRIQTGPKRTRPETPAEWRQRLGEEKWEALRTWQREHRFHPHQLRHAAATRLRKLFGLEAAGVVLGQRTMAATLIYAEQDRELAAKVMGQIG